MSVWTIFEIAVSSLGIVNVVKGVYNMYCDADEIKTNYKNHTKTREQYYIDQLGHYNKPLTDSQYIKHEQKFVKCLPKVN